MSLNHRIGSKWMFTMINMNIAAAYSYFMYLKKNFIGLEFAGHRYLMKPDLSGRSHDNLSHVAKFNRQTAISRGNKPLQNP